MSIFGISKAIGNYTGGRLSDWINRKYTIILGLTILIIGSIIIAFIQNLLIFFVGNFILGLGIGNLFSSSSIILTDLASANHRAKAVSMMELSVYGGTSVGAFVAGSVADQSNFSQPFTIALILVLVGVIVTPLIVDTTTHIEEEQKMSKFTSRDLDVGEITKHHEEHHQQLVESGLLKDLDDRISELIKTQREGEEQLQRQVKRFSPSILLTYTSGIASRISDSAVIIILPLFLLASDFSTLQLGIATSSFTIAWAIGIGITGPTSDKIGRKIPLIGGLFMESFGLGILIIPLLNKIFIVILMGTTIAGLGRGIYYPIPSSIITDYVKPEKRGRSLGLYRFFLDFGYVIGSVILVIVVESLVNFPNVELTQIFLISFLLVVIILTIQIILSSIFLKDPRPGYWQFPDITKHFEYVGEAFFHLSSSIIAFSLDKREDANKYLRKAKETESKADMVLQEITRKTYAGIYEAPDALELVNFSSKMDKALGHGIRAVRKLIRINQQLSKQMVTNLAQYAFVLDVMLQTMEETMYYIPIRVNLAAQKSYQISRVEDVLDDLHLLLWDQLIDLSDDLSPINILLTKETLESLEKSANTIDDAAEIVRLIYFKHEF